MSPSKPQFELTRVYADGPRAHPEVVPLTALPWDTQTDRRGFLGAGIAASLLLVMLEGTSWPAAASQKRGMDSGEDCAGGFAHIGYVYKLAATPDGATLVSGSNEDAVKSWSLARHQLVDVFPWASHNAAFLSVSSDGKLLFSGTGHAIQSWRLQDGASVKELQRQADSGITCGTVAPDGRLLAAGTSQGAVELWNLQKGELLRTLPGGPLLVSAVAFDARGALLGSGDQGSNLTVWDVTGATAPISLRGHRGGISALAFCRNSQLLVSASHDKTIRIWQLPQGSLVKTLERHREPVLAIAISPDGRLLASGGRDGIINLWALPDGRYIRAFPKHPDWISSLLISPDGKMLVAGSYRTIKLWDLNTGVFISCLTDLAASPPTAHAITYTVRETTGQILTYTMPCGSPIPPGAICTCNCVPGSYAAPPPAPSYTPPAYTPPTYTPTPGQTYCTCNKICTCIPVYR